MYIGIVKSFTKLTVAGITVNVILLNVGLVNIDSPSVAHGL